jgi:Na+/proline symporter
MAAAISGFSFIGGPGLVYRTGMGAMFIVLPAAITGAMSAWVLAKRLRLLGEFRGLVTIPDAIGLRYSSRLAQGLAGIAILTAIVIYMATNILALGLVIDAIFGTGLAVATWIGMIVTLAYSVSGGILAGVYNDLFQGMLMAVASVLVFVVTLKVGGGMTHTSHTILAARPELMGPWGAMSPVSALSLFFVFGMGVLGQPHVIHKYYMLRDPRRLKWMPMITTLAILLTVLLYYGIGMTMRSLVESGRTPPLANAETATPLFLLQFAPLLLAATVFSGVAAAIMSTVNSFMSIGAAVLTYDLPKALGRAPSNALLHGRLWTVAIGITATMLALIPKLAVSVSFLGILAWGIFTAAIVPALAIGLNWRGATREGGIASICTGLVMTLALESYPFWASRPLPTGVSGTGVALVASILVFLAVSRATQAAGAPIDPVVALVMDA